MNSVKKTGATVSHAVREFLNEANVPLESVSLNLVCEKVFIDKKEYTVECSVRPAPGSIPRPAFISDDDTAYAREIVENLLTLMRFTVFKTESVKHGDAVILRVTTPGKDGLLIGKNGQNIMAMQYLLSNALDKNLKRHTQVIIDVDSYVDKRAAYLKGVVKTMAEKAAETLSESITDFLPSYERKLIHEEVKNMGNIKTFSIGRGSYKKVVITSLL
jgi:predicted RNA-binding protein Jag